MHRAIYTAILNQHRQQQTASSTAAEQALAMMPESGRLGFSPDSGDTCTADTGVGSPTTASR